MVEELAQILVHPWKEFNEILRSSKGFQEFTVKREEENSFRRNIYTVALSDKLHAIPIFKNSVADPVFLGHPDPDPKCTNIPL